jgi:hypothetical protein
VDTHALGHHGKLYAFDQDENAEAQVPQDKRIVFGEISGSLKIT